MKKMEKNPNAIELLNKIQDEECAYILAEIINNPKGIGFNQLHRNMRKHPQCEKMAKSTLSKHLKHLMEDYFIEKDIEKQSNPSLKPGSNYKTTKHFRELTKNGIAQSTTPEDFLPLMRAEDAQLVTKHLLNIMQWHLRECLKAMLQAPESISKLNMHQAFYILETLMTAYRKRIRERGEEKKALQAIDHYTEHAREMNPGEVH
jgi:DNA-binding HxlR family transcriptional regulator